MSNKKIPNKKIPIIDRWTTQLIPAIFFLVFSIIGWIASQNISDKPVHFDNKFIQTVTITVKGRNYKIVIDKNGNPSIKKEEKEEKEKKHNDGLDAGDLVGPSFITQ